MSEIES